MGLDEESEQARYADIANPPGFLRALKEIVATDLSAEPVLRALIRQHVFRCVSVRRVGGWLLAPLFLS